MHVKYRGVNEAFRSLVENFSKEALFNEEGDDSVPIVKTSSRNGPVLYVQEPVTITYTNPRERVLFNQARDANPFFHLYESLWMLAGRNDVAPLKYYVSTIDQFSDDGVTFNGAYGDRWRVALGDHSKDEYVDQLALIIEHLKAKPDSRRAVLHMSNVEQDLLKIDSSRDCCCNLVVTFLIREDPTLQPVDEAGRKARGVKYLDMTVFNRSNDMILGMLGANVVHFSMLQEYMAACIGVEVGHYHQITNNMHVYEWNFKPEKWLADESTGFEYDNTMLRLGMVPLVKDPATFDREVVEFVERHSKNASATIYDEPFLNDVAQPMMIAFHWHKERGYREALYVMERVKADDWRIAGTNWLLKRKANHEARLNKS